MSLHVPVRSHYRHINGKLVRVKRHTREVEGAAPVHHRRRSKRTPKTTFEEHMAKSDRSAVHIDRINEDGPHKVNAAGNVDSDAYAAALKVFQENTVTDEEGNLALSDEEVRRTNTEAWDHARLAITRKTGNPPFGDNRNIRINNAATAALERAQQDAR